MHGHLNGQSGFNRESKDVVFPVRGKSEGGANIGFFKLGKVLDDLIFAHAIGEHGEDVVDRDP